jgi:hypothetical protein
VTVNEIQSIVDIYQKVLGPNWRVSHSWGVNQDALFIHVRPMLDFRLQIDGVVLVSENREETLDKTIPYVKSQLANWAYTVQSDLEREEEDGEDSTPTQPVTES